MSKSEKEERNARFQRHRHLATKAYQRIRPKLVKGAWHPDEVIDEITRAIDAGSADDRERLAVEFESSTSAYSSKQVADHIRKYLGGK